MKSFTFFLLLNACLLLISPICAQTIHGIVTDTLSKAVSFASVTLRNSDNIIITYTSCSENGSFSLTIPANINRETLWVEAASLGYKKQVKPVSESNNFYTFFLLPAYQQLDTVIIKDRRPKIKIQGDTISYKVTDFSNPQDKVIGDVLKKLPGIDVSPNGKISYNGKAIAGFYINGDNLLDDKYNIATTTVPNEVVENVQIIENHQPIRVLRNKSYSDNVALNITFKKDAKLKLLGQAAIAGGLPNKYDVNVNGMTFKDNYKAINYIKANNTGIDVANDLISHNAFDYLKRTDNNKPRALLSPGTAGTPDLPENRYLFNQGLLFNMNNLVNIKKDVQLKANISYLHDNQNQQYQKLEQIYLIDDTVAYSEEQNNKQKLNGLSVQINMNVNKDKYYLNNTILGDLNYNPAYSMLTTNNTYAIQNLKNKAFDFSNELSYLQPLKSGLFLNFYSYTNRITKPEVRIIEPGLNPIIFNDGQPYKRLEQRTNIPTWVTNNYISMRFALKKFSLQQKIGFNIQSQLLESDLLTTQNNNVIHNALDSSSNDLNWLRKKFYTTLGIDFSGAKTQFSIALPLSLQQTVYHEDRYQLSQSSLRLYFNPSIQFKYQTGLENYIAFNYNLMNNVGDINEIYRGYILKNYRTLYASSTGLTEQKNQNVMIGFYYRKGIKLFFFNLNIGYKQNNANSINSSVAAPDFQRRITLPFNNITSSWEIAGTISKYLFFLNTTASCSPNWQLNNINLLQNGMLFPYKTQLLGFNAGFETKLNKKLSANYRNYFTYINSYSLQITNSEFSQMRQHAGINYTPISRLSLKLSADYYSTHQPLIQNSNSFFTDFTTQFNFSKRKISLELNAINLFNSTRYSTAYLSGNIFSSGIHKIPGRMIIGKIVFNY